MKKKDEINRKTKPVKDEIVKQNLKNDPKQNK